MFRVIARERKKEKGKRRKILWVTRITKSLVTRQRVSTLGYRPSSVQHLARMNRFSGITGYAHARTVNERKRAHRFDWYSLLFLHQPYQKRPRWNCFTTLSTGTRACNNLQELWRVQLNPKVISKEIFKKKINITNVRHFDYIHGIENKIVKSASGIIWIPIDLFLN